MMCVGCPLTVLSLSNLTCLAGISAASGGGKPHKEKPTLLWIFAVAAAVIGSKVCI